MCICRRSFVLTVFSRKNCFSMYFPNLIFHGVRHYYFHTNAAAVNERKNNDNTTRPYCQVAICSVQPYDRDLKVFLLLNFYPKGSATNEYFVMKVLCKCRSPLPKTVVTLSSIVIRGCYHVPHFFRLNLLYNSINNLFSYFHPSSVCTNPKITRQMMLYAYC